MQYPELFGSAFIKDMVRSAGVKNEA